MKCYIKDVIIYDEVNFEKVFFIQLIKLGMYYLNFQG